MTASSSGQIMLSVEHVSKAYSPPKYMRTKRFFARFGGLQLEGLDDDDDDDDDIVKKEEPDSTTEIGGPRRVVSEVSLESSGGAHIAIVGPPEAGKTVLLKMIGGIVRPTNGRVVVRGRVAPALAVLSAALPSGKFETSFARGLPYIAALVGIPPNLVRHRLVEIADLVGVRNLARSVPTRFDRRQRAEIILAMMLCVDPDVFLTDIPTGQDAFGERCRRRIEGLLRAGCLVVTEARGEHSLVPPPDRVIRLDGGRMVADERVVAHPTRDVPDQEERAAGRGEGVVREPPAQADVPADGERASVEDDESRTGSDDEGAAVMGAALASSVEGRNRESQSTVEHSSPGFVGAGPERVRRATRVDGGRVHPPTGRNGPDSSRRSYSRRAMPRLGGGEASWVRGAQAGSVPDLEALFREHWPRAHRAAYLVVQDAAAAEDIAQKAFLAAIRALDRFDRRRPFGPWLHRIVVNRAIDWARARALRAEVGGEALAERPAPELALDAYSEPVAAALAALAPEHRAVIVLRHLLEYTPGEIADMLELPRGTVNSRLRRGLDRLREELPGDEDDD
jgi:RNA polymerase sigma-70 factor, ECF subfamily